MIRRSGPLLFVALLATAPVARGQGTTASPLPAGPVSNEALLRRFEAMERANQKLIEEVQRLARDNKRLTEEVQGLSAKVGGAAGEVDADAAAGAGDVRKDAGTEEKAENHLANAYDSIFGPERPEDPTRARGSRTSVLMLPGAQDVGFRRLSRVPMKPFYFYEHDGLGLETEDQEFRFKIRAETQADARLYAGTPGSITHSGFYLPRTRFYFQGHYTKPIDYQLSFQQGFGSFGVLNAFLNFNYFDSKLQLRIGRFKVPFTYEWYKINNFRLITPERSLFAANFGVNREVGAMLWGGVLDGRFEYAVGMFGGARNSFQNYDSSPDVAAFVNVRPFLKAESPLKNFNVGGSVVAGSEDNPLNPTSLVTNANASAGALGATNADSNATVPWLSFNSNVKERGRRELWELHAAYYVAGLSFLGGWGAGTNGFAARGASPVQVPVGGWYSELAYLVTGETLNERTVIDPIRRFDLRRGRFGLGAFEPFARYSELGVGSQVFTAGLADPNLWTNRARLLDVGVNWYLNRAVKIYLDWQHAMFGQPVFLNPGTFQKTNDLFWLRVQLYF